MKLSNNFRLLVTHMALLFAFTVTCNAQTATAPPPTPYKVVKRDANSDILQQTYYQTSPAGKSVPHVRSVTRIATGLNYWDGTQWSPSDPTFQMSADGQYVYANKMQTKVQLSANLAASNSVSITTPDGIVLNTTPVAVGLYDAISGSSLIIASVTNCTGTLLSSTEVLYQNAFNGISGDILYTLERGSFSQDIIWEQNIDPTDYGFPTNSQIQIFSAFNAPTPQETARPIYVETNQTIRAQMATPDFIDHTLKFGQLEFGPGRARPTAAANRFGGAPIAKDFQTINGQAYLVESIQFKDIRTELQALPQPAVPATVAVGNQSRNHEGTANPARMAVAKRLKNLFMPKRDSYKKATFAIKSRQNMVADALKQKGVVADYVALPATEPDPMVFQSDTTYFVDGPARFDDVVFEGGTVIKYPIETNAFNDYIIVYYNLTCNTSEYLPAIFTAADDDSVGQSMNGIWTNYTGTVQAGGYANPALVTYVPFLHNLRISDAVAGLCCMSESDGYFFTVRDTQVINCGTAFTGPGFIGVFENVLVANCTCVLGLPWIGWWETYFDNATIVGCGTLNAEGNTSATYVYNSILANVTNLVIDSATEFVTGTSNGFYNCDNTGPGGTNFNGTTTASWPFQSVGGGNYYLADGTFRGLENTNVFSEVLIGYDPVFSWVPTDLATRTTWPPILYDGTDLSSLGMLTIQAQRDTNSSPDLGYHYPAIDYLIGGCDLETNLVVTPGTTIGWFNDYDLAYGIPDAITLDDGAALSFDGTATQPCYFAENSLLQENEGFNWYNNSDWASGALAFNGSGNTNLEPELSANFSKWTSDANANPLGDSSAGGYGTGSFKNCELYNGQVSTYNMLSLDFTNCLLFREAFSFWDSSWAMNFDFENCTFYNGQLAAARSTGQNASFWDVENSTFDGTLLVYIDGENGASGSTAFDHNAYNTNNLSWQTYYFPFSNWTITNTLEDLGPSDVMTTNYNWQSSWFGDFYLPPDSPLITNGNTTAIQVGLYHFTTQTNQTVDGTNIVTIGYHYVAADTNGIPLDSNGDGIPDYIEDTNGLGILGPQITLRLPTTGSFYTEPATIEIQAIVSDWSGLLTNVDFVQSNSVQGSVSIVGFQSGPYAYTWPIVTVGQYGLTGFAYDASGLSATSAVVNVTVTNFCGF